MDAVVSDHTLIDFSDYALQLKQYLDAFPREQIHVLTLEHFRDNRNEALASIFKWLGVDATFRVLNWAKSMKLRIWLMYLVPACVGWPVLR